MTRYVKETMVSQVNIDGEWRETLSGPWRPDTKKADIETGEDQKGE